MSAITFIPCSDRLIILLAARYRALREALLPRPEPNGEHHLQLGIPLLAAMVSMLISGHHSHLPRKLLQRLEEVHEIEMDIDILASLVKTSNEVGAAQVGYALAGLDMERVLLDAIDDAESSDALMVTGTSCSDGLRLATSLALDNLNYAVGNYLSKHHPTQGNGAFSIVDDIATVPVIAVLKPPTPPVYPAAAINAVTASPEEVVLTTGLRMGLRSILDSAPDWDTPLPI